MVQFLSSDLAAQGTVGELFTTLGLSRWVRQLH